MSKKTYTAEQIIVHLREVEVLCSQGKPLQRRQGRLASQNRPITAEESNTEV